MKFLISIILLFPVVNSFNHPHSDAIIGVWQNGSGKGHIQIFKDHGKYHGRIIWLKDPIGPDGIPKTDKKNPNQKLRNKPIIGAVVLRDFIFDDGEWVHGKIYNPEDGKEYKSYLKLQDQKTLAVRGYIGISWIGKTDTWTRIR